MVTADPTLTVTFSTVGVGGAFAPLNCQAVWIEDAEGVFVKTIGRWCTTTVAGVGESEHLVAWRAKAGPDDIDAVSGATRQDHGGQLVASWDLKDKLGVLVPDGIYRIRFENADSNSSTTGQNAQSTFEFTKGPAPDVRPGLLDPLAAPLMTSPTVSIDYNPTANECNNNVVDPGETCDPPGSCPVDCESTGDACSPSVLVGNASLCTAACQVQTITSCVNGDGCCAVGCTAADDTDCSTADLGGCASGGESNGGLLLFGMLLGAAAFVARRRR